jgi:hypothetical protein
MVDVLKKFYDICFSYLENQHKKTWESPRLIFNNSHTIFLLIRYSSNFFRLFSKSRRPYPILK